MIHMETAEKAIMKKKKKKSSSSSSSKSSSRRMKEEGMKVVYISNPMKFNISPSEFRSLVQKLTGQYADYPSLYHQYNNTTSTHPPASSSNSSLDSDMTTTYCSYYSTSTTTTNTSTIVANNISVGAVGFHPPTSTPDLTSPTDINDQVVQQTSKDEDDDVFVPEMLENSALFYSWHLDMITI